MVRYLVFGVSLAGALGMAAAPQTALRVATEGSEALSALLTGAFLLLLASAARRAPADKD